MRTQMSEAVGLDIACISLALLAKFLHLALVKQTAVLTGQHDTEWLRQEHSLQE